MAGAKVIGQVAIVLIAAAPPAFAQQAPPSGDDRNVVTVLVGDLKSMVSKESVPVWYIATALALVASPFDESLTYSASCSTFLKTTFEGWARVAGQEWVLAGGAADHIGGAGGGLLIGGSIQ